MCDGQYHEMQNYLREQKESIGSINLVGEVASFLQQIFQNRHINSETVKVLHQLLQTLIEMSVGNYTNQEVIFNEQIMSVINHILQLDITNITIQVSDEQLELPEGTDHDQCPVITNPETSELQNAKLAFQQRSKELHQPQAKPLDKKDVLELREKALDIKSSAVELLEAMLEETSPKTKSLALQIAGALDIGAVQSSLVDFDHLSQDKELKKEQYEDNAERALYRTYHILVHLNDHGVPIKKLSKFANCTPSIFLYSLCTCADCNLTTEPDGEGHVLDLWKKCERESKSVEVVYKNTEGEEILTKVHFHFSPKVAPKRIKTSLTF